jgi:hypothetical protein
MKMLNVVLVLLMLGVSFAGLTVPGTSVSQDSFKPGSNGVMTITVASAATTEKIITSVGFEIDAPPEITITDKQFIGSIEPGGSTTISLPFTVSDDATSSIYKLPIEVTGISDRATGGYDFFTRRISLTVTVVDAPLFSFSTEDPVLSGVEQVGLAISNNGGPADNLRITIPETSDIALYGINELYVAELDEDMNVTLLLDARGAEDGAHDLPLDLEFEDELGIQHTESTKLRMTVRNEQLDLIITQKSDLRTREEGSLTLEVKNDGKEDLEDVRIAFQGTDIRMKAGEEFKFGDIKVGESKSVSMEVFTELAPGLSIVSADVDWIERDLQKSQASKVSITVTSDADVAVYLEAKPLPLTMASEHTISVLVSNLGSYSIENVDVSISSPAFQSRDISDTQYIGGLQRDDFSTVQFLMLVNASAEGTHPVDIEINYRDLSGEWKSKSLTQDITVYNGTVTEESPMPLLLGAGVVVVLVWWFKFRKK